MHKVVKIGVLVGVLLLALWAAAALFTSEESEQARGLDSFAVPEGFEVELVAGPDLISYPMFASLDDRGRLFVFESTGPNTMTTEEMLENPSYRISIVEDEDGDGVFDRSNVFADEIPLPQGGFWKNGSLYVAASPDLLRLDDTDDDGVADHREVLITGWTLSVNAATLHGPFFGPDGWMYLTDARRSYEIETLEGTTLQGKGGRIWRCRLDGSELEWVSAGGFDNPVEIIFTPAGETIGTMTYFVNPQAGQRDALMHWVEGGVYPKWHSVIDEDQLVRTGGLMPVMTKFARVAPSGLERYRSSVFGDEFQDNLFSAQFNTHRVLRHQVSRTGATFQTENSDFLTSTDPDFHPTDVLEDADGSLLVLDTGGWFIKGCPLSRVTKPEFKGGIYRIRKSEAEQLNDPWGRDSGLDTLSPQELTGYLEDPRPRVRDRVADLLVAHEESSVPVLAQFLSSSGDPEARAAATFILSRIGTTAALTEVRRALDDDAVIVRVAAARAVGLERDEAAVDRLMEIVRSDEPAARRQAATALGRLGDPRAVEALLVTAEDPTDRFVEHAVIYSLIQFNQVEPLVIALDHSSPSVQKAALIALDQMEGNPLRREQLLAILPTESEDLRHAALWVASRHPEWSSDVMNFVSRRLDESVFAEEEAQAVEEVLVELCEEQEVQQAITGFLKRDNLTPEQRVLLVGTMEQCQTAPFPQIWIDSIREQLRSPEDVVRSRSIELIRSHGLTGFDEQLNGIAGDPVEAADIRTAALDALILSEPELTDDHFSFLIQQLKSEQEAPLKQLAAGVLGKAELSDDQRLRLAQDVLPEAEPLILTRVLDAFRGGEGTREVGMALVSSLEESSHGLDSYDEQGLQDLISGYPEEVQQKAQPLFDRLEDLRANRLERLEAIQAELKPGDVGHGREIFFGNKVGCSSCHTVGIEGGLIGPDLTSVGAIRSRHDLLEAIVFPSASFVREYEAYRVRTQDDIFSGVIMERTPDVVVLATGARTTIRIPRERIVSMEPSSISIMPEGLNDSLTTQELSDLIAFMEAQKSRPEEQQ